jgi:hypothetical protein
VKEVKNEHAIMWQWSIQRLENVLIPLYS